MALLDFESPGLSTSVSSGDALGKGRSHALCCGHHLPLYASLTTIHLTLGAWDAPVIDTQERWDYCGSDTDARYRDPSLCEINTKDMRTRTCWAQLYKEQTGVGPMIIHALSRSLHQEIAASPATTNVTYSSRFWSFYFGHLELLYKWKTDFNYTEKYDW